MFEFHMAWTALRSMGEGQKSACIEWPWWSQLPSFSWLPSRRGNLDSKDKDPESQNVTNTQNQDGSDESEKRKWTLAHCYFANMGGLTYTAEGKRHLITAQQLAKMEDLSHTNPEVAEEDIKDKSKQDWLAKVFAALQISQLILSIVTRHIQGLDFSQLETVTLSFAICGVLIYCTYFYKPQNIGRPIEFKHDTRENAARFSTLQSDKTFDSFWAIMLNKKIDDKKTDSSKYQRAPRVPNDNIPINKGNNDVHPVVYLLALASGLFGAIHAIAWTFEFPTEEEKLLWQIATCVSAGSPVIGLRAIPFAQFTKAAGDPELFARNCLRLMQEYSWHTLNMPWVRVVIKDLEDAIVKDAAAKDNFAKDEPRRYLDIFRETGDNTLKDAEYFLTLEGRFRDLDPRLFELHGDKVFVRDFQRLINCWNGRETKKIEDAARVGVWPRQSLLPRGVNQCILYFTGFLYCASRLILLGVSISSIRKMPGSVYLVTDWTEYLPTFSAMGG
ncbi:hypothetical protein TRIATDRAFT_271260 [Trichoderma atroviride IMI 206040]|uniref:Uncharacterized protein n=1 Tax=Hypocrea atroviridis (strain ATCC 20476 / IMI 206040) TaxID=452589 RepID=G9NK46_HYPAI|nr:uncharacterized protein TRIATDRAFT_271260 [Trichoderma atroviride IMI 206040]EHK49266.1 hypothetical protein TRIATDRAFT_271260 [Trichoderma atroviride IMI 206040]